VDHVAAPKTTSSPAIIPPVPQTGSGCVNTFAGDPPEVCLTVYGTGLYVDDFVVSVASGYAVGYFKVVGPTGVYWPGSVKNVEGGGSDDFVVDGFVPAGNYWGYFEIKNPNGSFTQTAGAYVTVHS
jgi:hypothetical protein